ncbi:hypothetical protein MMA231_00979 [Asticcacaulis sp. MM231]|uniref:tape measure protein n=1 Tax=Asticcacaulis sp. MM231 TaxID=3157666 RepID=UPI0032D5677A
MKISAVFEAIDKITAPVKKIGAALGGLKKSVKDVGTESKKTGNETGILGKLVERSGESFKKAKRGISDGIAALQLFGEEAEKTRRKSSGLLSTLGGLTAGLTGLLGGVSFIALGVGIIGVNSQFEKFQATLETIYDGDAGRAKSALVWIQKFAKDTPYELDQVTDAFVKLSSYGIDPQVRALKTLGNAASGMNKSLDQAVEAMADARTFEFERLKEFGITSQQQADKVRFTYTKAGKATTIVVKKTAEDVQNALLNIFDARFMGGMDRQSKTLSGIWSNLMDFWTGFQKKIGDKGVFDKVKTKLGGFLDWLNDPKNQSKIDEWSTKISDALGKLFDAFTDLVTKIEWVKLIDGLTNFVKWLGNLIDKVGGLQNLVNIGIAAWIASFVFGLNALTPAIVAVGGALLGLEIAAWPITLIIGLIALLAAGVYLVIANWDTVKKWFSDWWVELKRETGVIGSWFEPLMKLPELLVEAWDALKKWFTDFGDFLGKWFIEKPKEWWDSMPEWFRNMLKGGALGAIAMTPGGSLLAPALAPQMFAPPLQGNAGGRGQSLNAQLDVRFKSDVPYTIERNTTSSPDFVTNLMHGRQGGG